jgi:hypothetical protein
MLRSSGYVPEEVRLSKEMELIKKKIKECKSDDEKTLHMKQLSELSQQYNFCIKYNRKFKK